MWETIKCFIIDMINFIISPVWKWFIDILQWIISFLPPTPFIFEPVEWGEFGKSVGYFIPVTSMFTHLAYALVAIAIFYLVQHVARMFRLIR